MKYAVEMGPGAMIYTPSLTKIGSDIQNLIWGTHRHTDSMVISYAYFFQIKRMYAKITLNDMSY
jgi:hypothetical protein